MGTSGEIWKSGQARWRELKDRQAQELGALTEALRATKERHAAERAALNTELAGAYGQARAAADAVRVAKALGKLVKKYALTTPLEPGPILEELRKRRSVQAEWMEKPGVLPTDRAAATNRHAALVAEIGELEALVGAG